MDYITGPPPPPAPKKKLQLPGGKLTKKEKPLWLTYRELADNELRKAANELLARGLPARGSDALDDSDAPTKARSRSISSRSPSGCSTTTTASARSRTAQQWAEAKAKAEAGDLAAATTLLDRLLAANPDRGERDGRWRRSTSRGASSSRTSSSGPMPRPRTRRRTASIRKAPDATDALAAHHYTLGKALEAQGKDGGPDFRKAVALKPDYAAGAGAAVRASRWPSRPVWMLYAAVLAGGLAALLFAFGDAAAPPHGSRTRGRGRSNGALPYEPH